MAGQPGFFDIDERLRELSSKGDDLERLKRLVDFELFRADLETAVPRADRWQVSRRIHHAGSHAFDDPSSYRDAASRPGHEAGSSRSGLE